MRCAAPTASCRTALYFATTEPGLPRQDQRHRHPRRARAADLGVAPYDVGGSVRSAVGAHARGARRAAPALAVLSRRPHRPAGRRPTSATAATARRRSCSATAPTRVLAEIDRRRRRRPAEFLDRWRLPGDAALAPVGGALRRDAYVPLAEAALAEALKRAGVTARRRRPRRSSPACTPAPCSARPPRRRRAAGGARRRPHGDGRQHRRRARGAAARRRARPGRARPDRSLVVVAGRRLPTSGVLRTTGAPTGTAAGADRAGADRRRPRRPRPTPTFLTWRGFLKREPPRRPEPERPAAPPAARGRGVEVRVRRQPLHEAAASCTCRRSACA